MSEKKQLKIGSSIAWSLLSRWSSKGIGMLNTIILARVLSPEDFGIVAMASIVVAMLESMTQIGVHLYVIRHPEDNPRIYQTAWTVTFFQSLVIALGLIISAPFVASYFGEQVLVDIVYCLALVKAIQGLQSYGVYIAQKKLDFQLDFKLTFFTRVSYLLTTIALALWLRNFWAIIFGQLVSTIIGVMLSYYLHSFRAKFDFYEWRKIFKFSMSTLPLSIGRFINGKADVVAMGKVSPTAFLGQYHVAANLASLFTVELLMPVIRGLLPNLSVIKGTPEFNNVFRVTVASAVYVFLPIGVGLALVSEEFVLVLLGSQWTDAANLLVWLSLYTTLNGIMMFMSEQFLVVIDKEQTSNRLMWFRNAVLISTILFTLSTSTYHDLPRNLVLATLSVLPVVILVVSTSLNVKVWFLISYWWAPLLAVFTMWLVFELISWPVWSVWFLFALKVIVGAVCYLAVVSSLYLIRGKPANTPEALLLSKVVKK